MLTFSPWIDGTGAPRIPDGAVLIDDTAYILSWTFTEAQWQSKTKLMRRVIGSFTVGA